MSVHFLEAGELQCRRPLWGDDESIGDVCGEATEGGASYCAACSRRMYSGATPRPPSIPREGAIRSPRDREPDLFEVIA